MSELTDAMRATSDALERYARATFSTYPSDGISGRDVAKHVLLAIIVALYAAANEMDPPTPEVNDAP